MISKPQIQGDSLAQMSAFLERAAANTTKLRAGTAILGEVYSYWRYSTPNQKEKESFERQNTAVVSYAKLQGWVIDRVFTDPETSGTMVTRAGLEALYEACRENPGSVVIVESMDRLCRDFEAYAHIYINLKRVKATLHSATNGPMSDLVAAIFAAIASEERKTLVRHMAAGRLLALGPDKHTGRPGYGYKAIERVPKVVPEQAEIVRLIFEMYASGASLLGICRELARRGVKSPSGKDTWNPSSVDQLLRRATFAGITQYRFDDSVLTNFVR